MIRQQTKETSLAHLAALRRFGKNIGVFWRLVVYALVLLSLASIWVAHPGFYARPVGWLALALAVGYLLVFTLGTRWVTDCDDDTYWKTRINTGRVLYPWRAVALWAALLALSIALASLDGNFVWLFWIPYGMSFTLLAMPQSLFLVIPTMLLILGYSDELPTSFTAPEMVKFAGFVVGFICYSAVVYLPIALLRSRFQRERMFLELEQSHRALEDAHHRLEQATEQERELAVLRERGRLARDMHDTLGHSLALMTVKLEAAQRLRPVDPARADHEVTATQAIARAALAELRAALADLRTPGYLHDCLGTALTRAAQESAARVGWELTCEIAPDIEPISDERAEALLRTGLEALANIERHAAARSVHLALTRRDDIVTLRIEDDGVGILATNPPQRVGASVRARAERGGSDAAVEHGGSDGITSPQGHYGITGMRERTGAADGSLTIGAGRDGHGTCVEARMPVGV